MLTMLSGACQTSMSALGLGLLTINEKSPGCKSPRVWLVMLSIDLATFVVRTYLYRTQMGSFGGVTS